MSTQNLMEKVAQMLYKLADELEVSKPTDGDSVLGLDLADTAQGSPAGDPADDSTEEEVAPEEVTFSCQGCGHTEILSDMNAANKAAAGDTPVEEIEVEDKVSCPQCEDGQMIAVFDSDSDPEEPADVEAAPAPTSEPAPEPEQPPVPEETHKYAAAPATGNPPPDLSLNVKANLAKIYESDAPVRNKYEMHSKDAGNNEAIAKFMSVVGTDRAKVEMLTKALSTVKAPATPPGKKTAQEYLNKAASSLTKVVREQTLLVVLLEFLLAKGVFKPKDLEDAEKAFSDLRVSMDVYVTQLFSQYDPHGLLPLAAAAIYQGAAPVAKQASTFSVDMDKVARYL